MLELQILKKSLIDKDFYNKVRPILSIDSFTESSDIFKIIINFENKHMKIPTFSEIEIEISDIQIKEKRENVKKILSEIKKIDVSEISNEFLAEKTLKFAKDALFKKALMEGAEFIDKQNENSKIKCQEILEKMNKLTFDDDLGMSFRNNLNERIKYYKNRESGLNYIDLKSVGEKLGGGFTPGTLSVFCAPAGVGKSLMLSHTACEFLKQGKKILLVSLEMSIEEFFKRIDANLLDLNIADFKTFGDNIFVDKHNELLQRIPGGGDIIIKQFSPGCFSARTLTSLLEMYKRQNIFFDIVMLDYIGIMSSDNVKMEKGLYQFIKAISEEIRAVAIKEKIPILSCSQLNRGAVNNLEADNSNISDSIGTLMTCDFVAMILQDVKMRKRNAVNFKITKNRFSGILTDFELNVNYSRMRFEDSMENPEHPEHPGNPKHSGNPEDIACSKLEF